ncbi:MAG TPA: 4-(cytidine 5'-diphospho)-2-C-methyl-D-erythritol kinase [Egibacteraceae bacterium]|nr:4-(cytidine 5'-diphospho)-2-C-methyl-D-erythritol kinase [Egibacteraceae bacterium]
MPGGVSAGRGVLSTPPRVTVRVPAKANLFLAVRDRRPDGYHEVATVMQSVSLYDELRVALVGPPARGHHPATRRRMRVELWHDPVDGLPSGLANLAVRAAHALGAATGVCDLAVTGGRESARTVIDLAKDIPVAAGMAGGSADAAGALVALNRLWGCDLSRRELCGVAASLGSDVPFCVVGGTALATGRGDALAPVLCRATFHWVVCEAFEPLDTAAVYRSWDRHCRPSGLEPHPVLEALRDEDPAVLGRVLHNDLEAAAFALRPQLAEHKAALLDAGALGAVLCGSGPTLLALAGGDDEARRLAAEVAGRFKQVAVARSPAGGPELRES